MAMGTTLSDPVMILYEPTITDVSNKRFILYIPNKDTFGNFRCNAFTIVTVVFLSLLRPLSAYVAKIAKGKLIIPTRR